MSVSGACITSPRRSSSLRGDAGARSLQTCDTDRKKEGGASRTGIRLSTAAALARYRLLDQSQQGGSRCRLLSAELADDAQAGEVQAIADVARRQQSTYVLMGRSRPARGIARLRTPLPQRLMQLLPGVDVRIVADRSHRSATDHP